MQIWFSSDHHFGHLNALLGWGDKSKARPFASLEEMTEGLIARHNEVVKPGDICYFLGDMFWRTFSPGHALYTKCRMNGQHFYILGNHEEAMVPSVREAFIWVKDYANIRPRKDLPSIVLSHYAHRVWDGSHKGGYHLYGHSHGAIPTFGRSFDVGVDCNDYYPVSLDKVHERLKDKTPELTSKRA